MMDARVAAVSIALMLLAGCVPVEAPPSIDEIAGSWTQEGPDGKSTRFDFSSDGTFDVRDVPRSLIQPVLGPGAGVDWNDLISTQGEWTVGPNVGGTDPVLIVDYQPSDEYRGLENASIYFTRSGSEQQLFIWVGPTDDGVKFFLEKSH